MPGISLRYAPAVPRIARFVCPGLPHHVTQRGNHRAQVFFSDADHQTYLALLREYTTDHQVAVLAYCLMPNHVHLVVVPAAKESLPRSLRHVHVRYAQRLNRQRDWKGHLWQGRYFASVLDERHCWAAIRYVERNPVRAGMVATAESYPWSSAGAHCGLRKDTLLTTEPYWQRQFEAIGNWSAWLAEGNETQELSILRKNVTKGLPCGSEEFITRLESASGRRLHDGRRGNRVKRMRPL
jgi:putative transposase